MKNKTYIQYLVVSDIFDVQDRVLIHAEEISSKKIVKRKKGINFKMKTIFYDDSGYPVERTVINKNNQCVYKQRKLTNLYRRIIGRLGGENTHYRNNHTYFNKKEGIYHDFNKIVFGKGKWVTTFETLIPRYDEVVQHQTNQKKTNRLLKGLRQITYPQNIGVIALSQNAKNIQMKMMDNLDIDPEIQSKVIQKIDVVHPPQELIVPVDSEQRINETQINLLFVGRDFVRKGGLDTVIALKNLRKNYKNFHLTIVSKLNSGSYALDDVDLLNFEKVKEFIFNTDWITTYSELPNDKVLKLMKSSDIGLLPTRADTYGYSILEMQAAGTPVITTNVRAIPEINTDKTGWIIDVPKNEYGEALYQTKEELKILRETIQSELINVLTDIFHDVESISERRKASLIRIWKEHNPKDYAKKIEMIYDRG